MCSSSAPTTFSPSRSARAPCRRGSRRCSAAAGISGPPPIDARVRFIDAYVLRGDPRRPEVLVLRRGPGGRNAGAWETVHGSVEPGERPEQAALRELREETGLAPLRLYNASRVEAFYQHRNG
ncbi:MAG: NUDIX domain-containing protein, partial [Chloroflexi bacterium]